MAEYYDKRVKLRRLDIGDLVLRRTTTATKDPTRESWVLRGKVPTESFTTQDKEVITWKPWTDRGSLDHGTLSI